MPFLGFHGVKNSRGTEKEQREYYAKKEEMLADYENRDLWLRKVIANIAKAGFFSSDRTITQYNEEIWNK